MYNKMLSCMVITILAYVSVASSRETIRTIPTITSSLVNLGKMEISFHFNGNGRDSITHQPIHPKQANIPTLLQYPKSEPTIDEPCPCSYFHTIKDTFFNNPTGLLNKILKNNNFFSFKNDPSMFCCDSHENVQEDTAILNFSPTFKNIKPVNTVPNPNNNLPLHMIPFLFDSLISNKSMLSPLKTKSIEIFLFPKKKDLGSTMKKTIANTKDLISKDNIHIVGNKELRNDIHLFKTVLPVVKKDLNLQEKNEQEKKLKDNEKHDIEKVNNKIIIEPAGKPNAV